MKERNFIKKKYFFVKEIFFIKIFLIGSRQLTNESDSLSNLTDCFLSVFDCSFHR